MSPTTPLNTGTGPVFRQLEAYNQGDAATFAQAFAWDVKVYNYPNELRLQGRNQLEKQYKEYFETYPDLHCELVSRVRIGSTVIDEERVTRTPQGKTIHAVAIYEVDEDLIQSVRFIMGT